MKTLLIIALLLPCTVRAQIKKDKALHFGAGMLIGGVTSLALKRTKLANNKFATILISSATSTLVAIGKEAYDQYGKKTFADDRDISWTAVGGFVGSISVTYTIKFKKRNVTTRPLPY